MTIKIVTAMFIQFLLMFTFIKMVEIVFPLTVPMRVGIRDQIDKIVRSICPVVLTVSVALSVEPCLNLSFKQLRYNFDVILLFDFDI